MSSWLPLFFLLFSYMFYISFVWSYWFSLGSLYRSGARSFFFNLFFYTFLLILMGVNDRHIHVEPDYELVPEEVGDTSESVYSTN